MKKILPITTIATALYLIGCAAQTTVQVPENDPAISALQATAEQIEQEMRQLVLLQSDTKQQGGLRAVLPKDGPLGKPTTMQWSGPIGPAVQQIAKSVRYEYCVTGAAPAAPITVSLDVTQKPAYTVLDTIAWQAAGKAQLLVDPVKQKLTLAYLPTFGDSPCPGQSSSHTAPESH
jgi:defect-in-organelle-trafficking protein DotD